MQRIIQGGMNTIETRTLQEVLEALAHATGGHHSPHRLEEALRDALRQVDTAADRAWAQVLVQAGQELGLSLTPLARSAEAVVAQGSRQGPLVTVYTAEGQSRWLRVEEWGPAGVRVHTSGQPEATWRNAAGLAALLGASSIQEERTWVLAEPARPMEALSRHGDGHEHGHEHPTPFERLKALLRLEREDVWAVVVYAMGVGVFALATPIAVQALVNTVAFGALLQPLVVLSVLLLGGLVLAAGLRALKAWVVERLQERLFVHVTSDLGHRLPRVHPRALEKDYGPELVNRFFDVVTLQKSSATLLLDGVSTLLQAAIGLVLLAFYHPLLLAFDVVLIAASAVIIFGYMRSALATSIKESKAKYAVAAWLQELVRHPTAFRGPQGLAFALRRTDELAREWLDSRRKHWGYLFRQLCGALGMQALASSLLLLLGGWLVINRQLTLGQLVAAELIVSAVLAALAKMGKHLESYYDLLTSLDKLGHLVDLPLEKDSGEGAPPTQGPSRLELRDVTFSYEGGPTVLQGVSLTLPPGSRVALSGACAAGRSTLVDLLFGLRAPTSGRVLLNNVDVRDLRLEALRRDVAVVKGPEIFNGPLVDNVRQDNLESSLAEVRHLLERLGLRETLERLPEGLQTQLATGGAPLSPSQALLVTLARALLRSPRLLVLDGVLDGLDGALLERVLEVLKAPNAPWTLLLITRREELLRHGEDHYTLVDGRLHEAAVPRVRMLT